MRCLFLALLLPLPASAAPATEVIRLGGNYINVYALRGDGVVLVDAHNRGKVKKLTRQLRRNDIAIDQVRAIIVTHGHADHAGSAKALSEACGCPIVVGAGDVAMVESGENPPIHGAQLSFKLLEPLLPDTYPPFTPDIVVDERGLNLADFGVTGRVLPQKGHSDGSVVVALADGQVVVGDLLRGGFYRPRRPHEHFLHADPAQNDRSIDAVMAMNPTVLWPGHGRDLSAERVRSWIDDGRR